MQRFERARAFCRVALSRGPFWQRLVYALARAPAFCRVASRRRILPGRGSLRKRLPHAQALPCAVSRHHVILAPAPTKSTARVELASMAEGATTAKPTALDHCARGKDGWGRGGREAKMDVSST